jgi:2-oxoisovalerate ferredoxin oxidoreductase beta subunit
VSTFYDRFERHDHARGLKARATHYCAGCGHGLVHKLIGEAIDELGLQDRTVAISPVGCSVFLNYYLDVGNVQAAHGRAPAVGLGIKLANPEAIVISYQGDGDLASIGLAEIISAAQLGLPFTVIFVNNAIYGMTGGQLAPTTLMGQRTTTSPGGRHRHMGLPLKMAELMAQIDGTAYVERVALFDAKQRVRAGKAIKRALQVQADRTGFAFVEVLAECPTHLGLTPVETERWVAEQMVPVFPLGVKKEPSTAPFPPWPPPLHEPAELLSAIGAGAAPVDRFCQGFPRTGFGDDVGLKLAGAGGDGAQTAAMLLTKAAINEGFDATHIPSYGPESRGGTSYADVRIAEHEVLSPAAPHPDALVAFNAPSLARFGPEVPAGGVVIYDSTVITEPPATLAGVRVIPVPCTAIAHELGQKMVKNVVALGALAGATRLFPPETLVAALRQALGSKPALLTVNQEALARGRRAAETAGHSAP